MGGGLPGRDGLRRLWKRQTATAEIETVSLTPSQGPLDIRHHAITHPPALADALDEPGVTKDAEVMGDVGLSSSDLPAQVGHAFPAGQERH